MDYASYSALIVIIAIQLGDTKECQGTHSKCGRLHMRRLDHLRERYQGCTVIHGDLELCHLMVHNGPHNTDFLNSIERINGSLLIYRTDFDELTFENLTEVSSSDRHSLFVEHNPQLKSVYMPKLEVVTGEVKVDSHYLCDSLKKRMIQLSSVSGSNISGGSCEYNSDVWVRPTEKTTLSSNHNLLTQDGAESGVFEKWISRSYWLGCGAAVVTFLVIGYLTTMKILYIRNKNDPKYLQQSQTHFSTLTSIDIGCNEPFLNGSDGDAFSFMGEDLKSIPKFGKDDLTVYWHEKLGSGNFGNVFKGKLSDGQEVAVKKLNFQERDTNGYLRPLQKEANCMANLQGCDFIVRLLGIYSENVHFSMLVTEFCPGGSLLKHLRTRHSDISLKTRLIYCTQIAEAMSFIKSQGIIHRDLATRNVLVMDENTVKVTDFGMSKALHESVYVYRDHAKPREWFSLESLERNEFSHQSDVWSFGVTCWEIFADGEHPYERMVVHDLQEFLRNGERLPKPERCGDHEYDIIWSCWHPMPDERTPIERLREMFTALSENISVDSQDNVSEMSDITVPKYKFHIEETQ